ncbi:hypothetical protein ACG7TL_001139 [Trametes sanguinea]
MKRNDRGEDGDDEYAYGTGAKRYKSDAGYQHDSYDGHAAASRLPVSEYPRAMTPAAAYALLSLSLEDERCAVGVYQLLGQDFDIFVEANADSYDQARKKWAECSGEEWTKGVHIAVRFGKMLDYVKDHMISKLVLYADLQASVDGHKKVLSEREQTLKAAKAAPSSSVYPAMPQGKGQKSLRAVQHRSSQANPRHLREIH